VDLFIFFNDRRKSGGTGAQLPKTCNIAQFCPS
jgi:hypothetical protein